MISITVKTQKRNQLIDITDRVKELVSKENIQEGVIFVYVPHTTAGIIINENADPSVAADILNTLAQLIPQNANYTHIEGNSDAHIKSAITSTSVAIPISQGRLALGRWQGIFFAEFDGPRRRELYIQIIPKHS